MVGLGLVGGVAGTISVSPAYGSVIALSVATAYGLLVGPAATVRYAIAIALASRRGRLPLRLGRFLDWGVSAGLFRTSGVAYQFRHEELRLWLKQQAAKA